MNLLRQKVIFYFSLSVLYFFLLAFTLEIILYITEINGDRDIYQDKETATSQAKYYTQFLHPYYYFSFPTNQETINTINRGAKTPWVDVRGYRGGIGPENKGNRKLAFLIGGSTAFGFGTEEYAETIPAVLNRIQEEYFFVNAAVPGWNSYQELLRILKELVHHDPELIVSLTGFNDIGNSYVRRSLGIPSDSPDSYEILNNWVEDIRSEQFRDNAVENWIKTHTWLSVFYLNRIKIMFAPEWIELPASSESNDGIIESGLPTTELIEQTYGNFVQNMELARDMCQVKGIAYIPIFQPFLNLHENYLGGHHDEEIDVDFMNFYQAVAEKVIRNNRISIANLTTPFQSMSHDELVSVYADPIHFNGDGYKLLAAEILNILSD